MQHWKEFVKAGNAVFTVEDSLTGERFTYHVVKCREKEMWWVKVLSGPDNVTNYHYLGTIFGDDFRSTRASKIGENARSFRWFSRINLLLNEDKDFPDRIKFYHANRCGRCGRRLTVPASVEWGFGPECVLQVLGNVRDNHHSLETAKKARALMLAQSKLQKLEQ